MLLQSDVAEVPAAEHAAGEQFPWQLKCCSSNGETKLYQLPKKADDLFFAGTHPYCAGVPLQCAPVSSYTGPVIQHTMATSPKRGHKSIVFVLLFLVLKTETLWAPLSGTASQ